MNDKIIFSCPFVPPEWIAAHDMYPLRITPATASTAANPEVCPYAHAFTNAVISAADAAAVIVTTSCDQMRRSADVIRQNSDIPLFLMNIPHTWQTPSSHKLYENELKRLGEFLVRNGGKHPSDDKLRNAMIEYDDLRASKYDSESTHKAFGIPVAVVGGPMPDSSILPGLIEAGGGYIALDATENGERALPARFDRRAITDNPFATLADAYFGTIPDPFRRPNSGLYIWLKRMLTEREIRGIILRRYVWCDNWHAEAQRLKEWSNIPFLHLDVGDTDFDAARLSTRVQSFMEMLR